MKSTLLKRIFACTLIVSSILVSTALSAQPSGGSGGPGTGGGGGGNPDDFPPGVPFDGGLSLILIAAGAGLGAKKVKDKSQANKVANL